MNTAARQAIAEMISASKLSEFGQLATLAAKTDMEPMVKANLQFLLIMRDLMRELELEDTRKFMDMSVEELVSYVLNTCKTKKWGIHADT